MIHKYSLLKEFKRDKRPVYTCMTQWEDICQPTQTELKMIQMVAKHAEEALRLYTKRLDEQLLNPHASKVIRLVRCNKLELPDDPKAFVM